MCCPAGQAGGCTTSEFPAHLCPRRACCQVRLKGAQMKFRALADQTDGSALGRGEVTWSPPCSELGVGFAKGNGGEHRLQDSSVVSSWWVFIPPLLSPNSVQMHTVALGLIVISSNKSQSQQPVVSFGCQSKCSSSEYLSLRRLGTWTLNN